MTSHMKGRLLAKAELPGEVMMMMVKMIDNGDEDGVDDGTTPTPRWRRR